MSVFVLKLIAVVSMFIDHLGYVLRLSGRLPYGALYTALRSIGRPAFVIFAFLLVNGFEKTLDRKCYLTRLIAFAALSQIPFTLAFTAANYSALSGASFSFGALRALPLLLPLAACFFTLCERRIDPLLLWLGAAMALSAAEVRIGGLRLLDGDLNVYYTLACAMAVMMFFEYLQREDRSAAYALLVLAALGAELYFVQRNADYSLMGVALILALYFTRRSRPAQLAAAALWCLLEYSGNIAYLYAALCALLPPALYNGRLGPKLRTFFYVFYPAHLALLAAVLIVLSRK